MIDFQDFDDILEKLLISEVVTRRCSVKKIFLKKLQKNISQSFFFV